MNLFAPQDILFYITNVTILMKHPIKTGVKLSSISPIISITDSKKNHRIRAFIIIKCGTRIDGCLQHDVLSINRNNK